MNTNYDRHDEHVAWAATRKTRRRAVRVAIAQAIVHLILSFFLLVAVIWATVDFFEAFGWAGAVPSAISLMIFYIFAFPTARHGLVLSLILMFESDHKKKSALQSMACDLPDLYRLADDHVYASRVFRRRIRRAMAWATVATVTAASFSVFSGGFSPLTGVEFCLVTLALFYLYARQKNSWTVSGFMRQNRELARMVREAAGQEGGAL